ncbi:MAG: carboxylesterase/lipase family protein, partial [Sphingomonadales bacterium]|nr:carboxylesterase/lipase family protein [Sphingomonadales bacterium]
MEDPMHFIMSRRASMLTGLAGGLLLGMPTRLWAQAAPSAVVETGAGKVRGRRIGGVSTFLGIPYGADTAQYRFLPPRAPKPWAGVRECVALGHQAPQMALGAGERSGPHPDMNSNFVRQVIAAGTQGMEVGNEGEDCLVLNVYTPEASPMRRRPVMVWFHGGGFSIGSAGDPQYDGKALARRGDVVVVGINHRLNALGFLDLGAISSDYIDACNVGMLDLVFALQWVRDNIANFGGDPGNVTIFGESGGGSKVSFTLALPAAHGLFHKAIIQSGAALTGLEKEKAASHAERTLAALGTTDVHKLPAMDYRQILTAAHAAQGRDQNLLRPTIDGRTFPRDPFTPGAPEVSRDVPIMIGTTKTEETLFMSADPLFGKMDEATARQRAARQLGAKADQAYDLVKAIHPDWSPTCVLAGIATANNAWIRSITLAERKLAQQSAPVFMYRLDWEAPFANGALKSPHGLDTDLVFDNPETKSLMNGTGPAPRKVAAAMSQAWIDFARNGDPSQAALPWPRYDTASRRTMIFNVDSRVVSDPDKPLRELLSS